MSSNKKSATVTSSNGPPKHMKTDDIVAAFVTFAESCTKDKELSKRTHITNPENAQKLKEQRLQRKRRREEYEDEQLRLTLEAIANEEAARKREKNRARREKRKRKLNEELNLAVMAFAEEQKNEKKPQRKPQKKAEGTQHDNNGNTATEMVEVVAPVEPLVEAVGSMETGVVEAVGTIAVPEDATPASSSKCEACEVAALNYQQIESSYILVNSRLSQSNAMLREQCRAKDRRIENARMKEQASINERDVLYREIEELKTQLKRSEERNEELQAQLYE